jgi:subtilisin family serine protease
MNRHAAQLIALGAAVALQGCHDRSLPTESRARGTLIASVTPADPAGRHVVVFAAERVPADFGERAARLGGSVEASLDNIGVAAVTGLSEGTAAELAASADIRAVEPDPITSAREDAEVTDGPADEAASEAAVPADATTSPTAAQFYARQWNMRAVFANQAWAAGHLGSRDVKVAILDSGIDYLHPDLVGLVDLEHSTSFVPEDVMPARYADRLPFTDLFWHGTAAASIVASNAKVLAGVNRFVTLIAVKVADSTDAGSFGRLLTGIVYAADQEADVINVSRGHERAKSLSPGFVAAFERAVNYAFRKGALLVTVPFNDAADLDHNGDMVRMPCEAANAICVSATGPTAGVGVNGPWENVDAIAPYSAFGRSAISVAAPGGAGTVTQFQTVWLPCTTTPTQSTVPTACRLRTQPVGRGIGTSWAAPHVAGLAALLVAQLGHGNPALIRARILQSVDDLGEPGVDPYYGKGRINVARALGLSPQTVPFGNEAR